MCLRLLRKRDTSTTSSTTVQTRKQKKKEEGSATSSPSQSAEKSDAELTQSDREARESESQSSAALNAQETDQLVRQRSEEQASAAPSPMPPPSPTSAVPTLFVTASGKAVTVRRESLEKAAEKFEGELQSPPPPPTPSPPRVSAEARVSTLFETASGKKVTVKADSLEKAKAALANLDGDSAETPPSVSTLFQTAAGSAVRVSEASLRKAREKMNDEDDSDSERQAETQQPVSPRLSARSSDAAKEEEAVAEGRRTAAGGALHNMRRPSSGLMGLSAGLRRGFVPPQQRLPTASSSIGSASTAAATVTSSSSLPPTMTAAPLRTARLAPLRYAVLSPSLRPACTAPPPSLEAIMCEGFCFSAEDCGAVLAALLGVKAGQTAGLSHWHACLLKLGASAKHCTVEWCRHALLSAFARMSCASLALPASSSIFSAESVLLCMLQAYNTEMVDGERPALRKMVEGDIPAASLTVLYLSSIREERSAPHMRIVTLSDGVYHMKVTCDVPLSNLLREGVLRPGQKLALCGAKLLLHGQCSPTECDAQAVLAINYNCVRAVAPAVPLGVCHGEPQPLPLSLVHPLGGLVPAIEGVVARVLPSFFITQESESVGAAEDGSRPARDRAVRAVRSIHAQLQVSDRLHREREGVNASEEPKPLSRVTSLLVVKDGAEALVQQWETVEERSLLTDEDGGASLPTEGSWVTLYAVNPARSRTAAAPFARAKLFFSSRKLHFVPSKKPLQHLRQVWDTAADKAATICVGDAADVCGLFMGHLRSRDGTFVLLLLRGGFYAVLQVPLPSSGRVLTFPIPSVEKTPLLILNATFLTAEDSVAGSDCCRVFANEYTVLLQRSTQHNFKEALESAAALRSEVEASTQKYTSRRAEIFRCLEEGETGGGAPTPSQSYAQRLTNLTTEAPMEGGVNDASGSVAVNGVGSSGGLAAASLPSREGRLPYYLRQSSGSGGGGRRLPGVFIPSSATSPAPSHAAQQSMPAETRSVAGAAPVRRHYGNVSDLLFLYDPRLNRRPWHPLEDALRDDDTATPTAAAADFRHVRLCWSVSAATADDVTCGVNERRQLHDLMEAACPLQELCSLIADEQHIDVSLRRSATVLRWRKSGQEGVWWRFFTLSRLLTSAAALEEKSDNYLWWLPDEWAEATKTLRDRLRTAFFFVLLGDGDALRHAQLISDACDVRELPRE